MLKEVRIQNYKSIQKLKLELGRVTVLIGENGCGKSNILEAIALASAAANDKLDNEFLAARGIRVTEPRFMRSAFEKENLDKDIKIDIRGNNEEKFSCILNNDNSPYSQWIDKQSVDYMINFLEKLEKDYNMIVSSENQFQQRDQFETILKHLKKTLRTKSERISKLDDVISKQDDLISKLDDVISKKDDVISKLDDVISKLDDVISKNEEILKDLVAKKEEILKLESTPPKLESTSPKLESTPPKLESTPPKKLFPLSFYLLKFTIYSPENSALRTFEKEGQIQPLGINGEGLFKLINVLNADNPDKLNQIKEKLRLIDWFKDFEIPQNLSAMQTSLQITDRYLDTDLSYFDQRSSNEGFLFLLFYFTLFISELTPKFFAIDNIDASLNPRLCRRLIEELVELAKKNDKQVILTTHNPAVLDGLDLDDDEQRLFVIYRNQLGHTKARRILKPKPLEGQEPVRLSEAFLRGYIGGLPKNF